MKLDWRKVSEPGAADFVLAVAVGLTALPALSFAFAQLLLLAGFPLDPVSGRLLLAIAVVASALISWAASGGRTAAALVVVLIGAGACALSSLLIDTSYDGIEYHFDAVNALAHGWNPYLTADGPPVVVPDKQMPWAAHYPMAGWLASAVQVAAGLGIEASKSPALILATALFLAAFGAASKAGLNGAASLALALATAANPVIVVQLFSRMNDGMLAVCFALVIIFGAVWVRERRPGALVGVILALVFGLNLKFSGMLQLATPCAVVCMLTLAWRSLRAAVGLGALLFATALAGLVVFGAHPYVTNALRMGHPLYPLMGPGKQDIMTYNRPKAFNVISPGERIVFSYLGPTSTGWTAEGKPAPARLKTPFSVERSEIGEAGRYDNRVGGFGPLFSGALVIAAIGSMAVLASRSRQRAALGLLALAAAMLASGLATPEAWWARYVPQIWWGPTLVAAAMLASRGLIRWGGWLLLVVLLANAGLTAASSLRLSVTKTREIHRQLDEIAAAGTTVCLRPQHGHVIVSMLRDRDVDLAFRSGPLPSACAPKPLAGVGKGAEYCLCP